MTALRIAHVVCTDAFAGVERYVLSSARCLAAEGCSVTVIGGAEAAMRGPLERAGIDWLPGSSVRAALASLHAIGRPDVINTHMTAADLAGVLDARGSGVPVVSTRHFASPRGSNLMARTVALWLGRRIAAQIAISEFVAANIEGPNTVVYTGVPSADLDARPRKSTVLVAQRLEVEKSTDVALRAWSQVEDRGSWRLQIAGTGSQLDALVGLAETLGVSDSVDFLGFRTDLDELLREASVFLAPTPREGLGLSVIEAMAHALPVVASRGGGHLETAGGVDAAALFDSNDAGDAARVLARLLTDAKERERYGLALQARQREVFNLTDQTDGTLRVLTAAAKG